MLHNETRKLLIEAVEKTHNVQEVADCYSVNRSTVYRLKKRWEETGSLEVRTSSRGRKPALSPEELESIDQLVKNKSDITLQEIIDTLHLTVSHEKFHPAAQQGGIPDKIFLFFHCLLDRGHFNLKSDSSFLVNNEILLPNRCHEGHQGLKSPVFTGLFRPLKSFPLAK